MSDSPIQNVNEKQELSSNSSRLPQNKDIIVSIIFTESTSSLLKLNLPHLEDLDTEENQSTVCVIKAESNIEETNYCKFGIQKKLCDFTQYWFGDKGENSNGADCEEVASDIAYFRSSSLPHFRESLQSILSLDQFEKNTLESAAGEEASTSLKLKPVKVYTRPLFTVRSLAHQDLMKSEKNTIYINVLNSRARMTDSGWINVCRICHGGESIGDLLAPCQCRGSIALAHMECLERWLKESTNSKCELCQHRFKIIRRPKYSIPKSIFVFLRHPGEHLNELLFDFFAFVVYTPSAIASTYMLILLCESVAKNSNDYSRSATAHVMTLAAVFGMAAIDFTYSSWFMANIQKHVIAWRNWYRNNCDVKVVLPARKLRHRRDGDPIDDELD